MRRDGELRKPFELLVDGLKLFGLIHEPIVRNEKFPCVLFLHGFGGNKSGRFRYLTDVSSALAEKGIASVRFDFRGAGDSEGLFEEQTVHTQLQDIRAVVDFIKKQPNLDISRFGLLGRSFGGYLATLFASELVQNGNSLKSLVLLVPFFGFPPADISHSNLPYPLGWNSRRNQMTFNGMPISHSLLEDVKQFSTAEALSHLSDVPLLHIQASKDKVVGAAQKQAYLQGRSLAHAENVFLDLAESDHELSDYNERIYSLEQVVAWFQKTL